MAKRVNRVISVPPKLNRRLVKHKSVNWSAVAVEAFEKKLGEIAAKKEVKDMKDVVDRLRASKLAGENEMYDAGNQDGKKWSESYAEYHELERLYKVQQDFDFDLHLGSGNYGPYGFVGTIRGEELDRDSCEEVIDQIFGEGDKKCIDTDYLRGFIDGALEVFQKGSSEI